MYNRRVSKCHSRVEAYGSLDELNSALGMARSLTRESFPGQDLRLIQEDLIKAMGELATSAEDLPRYITDGYPRLSESMTRRLEELIKNIESRTSRFSGWAIPGDSQLSASLDVARTTCRRAERRVCVLQEAGELQNAGILIYLNRLADLLWLLARSVAK